MTSSMRPGTELVNHLVSTWAGMLATAANEERVVGLNFTKNADLEVERFGNLLTCRKIAAIAGNTLASTDEGTGITYSTNTEAAATVSPTAEYAAVQIPLHSLTRAGDWPSGAKYMAAYRTQLIAGCVSKEDIACATLATSATGIGGAGQHLTKDLIIQACGTLITNSKDHSRQNRVGGTTPKWLYYHPDEVQYVYNQPQLTESRMTGQASAPTITGKVWDAYGLELFESGNVYQASGITHNLAHVRDFAILVYNQEPEVIDTQFIELVWRIIAFGEFGTGTYFSEYGVDVMTGN